LTDTIEVDSNPFDEGKNIVGLGNKIEKTSVQRERQKNQIESKRKEIRIIKQELRQGNIVQSL
jgi:hypothetical protein